MGILRFKAPGNHKLPATIKKSKFALFKKVVFGSFRQRIAIGKCKKSHSGRFRHIHPYSDIFTLKFETFMHLYGLPTLPYDFGHWESLIEVEQSLPPVHVHKDKI